MAKYEEENDLASAKFRFHCRPVADLELIVQHGGGMIRTLFPSLTAQNGIMAGYLADLGEWSPP